MPLLRVCVVRRRVDLTGALGVGEGEGELLSSRRRARARRARRRYVHQESPSPRDAGFRWLPLPELIMG
jgi:hypothetical protein